MAWSSPSRTPGLPCQVRPVNFLADPSAVPGRPPARRGGRWRQAGAVESSSEKGSCRASRVAAWAGTVGGNFEHQFQSGLFCSVRLGLSLAFPPAGKTRRCGRSPALLLRGLPGHQSCWASKRPCLLVAGLSHAPRDAAMPVCTCVWRPWSGRQKGFPLLHRVPVLPGAPRRTRERGQVLG